MTPQLNFQFLHSERIGYGAHGLATFAALQKIGVDVYDGLPGSGDLDIAEKRSKVCKDILFLTIPTHVNGWYEGQRAHLFTMWEADELPEAMRQSLHNFDTILTPSQDCVALYSKYHDNVHYVPLGVDGNRWHFQERNTKDHYFNFLVAGSGMRKGTDLVHRAFMELFGGKQTDGPIPRLIMKNPKGENYGGRNVEVISGYLPAEDEVALYASAHCMVAPSRGEGWGMQPLQAMAQGCPTILTNAHGHSAFAKYARPIDATLVPAKYMTLFGDAGQWWEPDYEQLKEAMLSIYNNYASYAGYADMTSRLVRKEFTWEKSAQAIVDVLGYDSLCERFLCPYIPTKWFTPEQKLFPVVTLRDWKADIGGVTHLLVKGQQYWKSADMKRVLFEAHVLDPACVSDGDGLTESQLERLGTYIADHSNCPTCGQHVPQETLETASC